MGESISVRIFNTMIRNSARGNYEQTLLANYKRLARYHVVKHEHKNGGEILW